MDFFGKNFVVANSFTAMLCDTSESCPISQSGFIELASNTSAITSACKLLDEIDTTLNSGYIAASYADLVVKKTDEHIRCMEENAKTIEVGFASRMQEAGLCETEFVQPQVAEMAKTIKENCETTCADLGALRDGIHSLHSVAIAGLTTKMATKRDGLLDQLLDLSEAIRVHTNARLRMRFVADLSASSVDQQQSRNVFRA